MAQTVSNARLKALIPLDQRFRYADQPFTAREHRNAAANAAAFVACLVAAAVCALALVALP